MKKTINIGEKEVVLTCNAYTPISFKALTGHDLISALSNLNSENPDTEIMSELIFVMAKQAGYEGTLEAFLSQFDLMDFYSALPEALSFWVEQSRGSSKPKKELGK